MVIGLQKIGMYIEKNDIIELEKYRNKFVDKIKEEICKGNLSSDRMILMLK